MLACNRDYSVGTVAGETGWWNTHIHRHARTHASVSVLGLNWWCSHTSSVQLCNWQYTDKIYSSLLCWWGTAVAQWLTYCATNQKVAGSIPDGVMEFFIDINPSGVDSASNRNEYREYFLGEMRPVRKADNLTTILEPSGPLQACFTFLCFSMTVISNRFGR
jgi:hypothetical protein